MKIEFENAQIMQLNITKKCNMSCYHCHVEASPKRDEMMGKNVIDKALEIFKKFGFNTLDITGVAPEMNDNFEYILKSFTPYAKEIFVRTNLTILLEKAYEKYIDIYKTYNVALMASVPFYENKFNDAMRGEGSFKKEIEVLKLLNEKEIFKINLIYNPNGAYLPPNQKTLEQQYKVELKKYGIKFDKLFCMCNVPIGRFASMLEKFDEYGEYLELLEESYMEENLKNVMCKNLINISYDGSIYDCDFNGAIDLKASISNVDEALAKDSLKREIKTKPHCFACVSGEGSSCFGAIR